MRKPRILPSGSLAPGTPTGPNLALAWIAAIVRQRFDAKAAPRELAVPPQLSESDWRQAGALLRANRLWGLVPDKALASIPPFLHAQRQRELARATLLNLRVLATTRRVGDALGARRIEALVIKGPLLQEQLFGSAFTRATTDVDLWIRPDDRQAAEAALDAAGFTVHPECRSLWWRLFLGEAHFLPQDSGLSEVDLHHQLHQAGVPRPARPELFFQAARPCAQLGGGIRLPSPPHAFLISSLALAKGLLAGEPVGHYAAEVAAACRGGGPAFRQQVWAVAREQGMTQMVGIALMLTEQTFALDLGMGQDSRIVLAPPAAREQLLAPGAHSWSRSRTIWSISAGAPPFRLARFAQGYGAKIIGEACRKLLHAPALRRRQHALPSAERDEPQGRTANPNPA